MTSSAYLAFGFALLFLLLEGNQKRNGKTIFKFYSKLSLAYLCLGGIDAGFSYFLWNPLGRNDLRFLSLFLWALVLERILEAEERKAETNFLGESPFFLALLGFSFALFAARQPLPLKERLWGGVGLIAGTGGVEGLLIGLRERVRLSNLPKALEGVPILFFLAGLLFLAWGASLGAR